VEDDVGTVNDFVEFSPDAFGLTFVENGAFDFGAVIDSFARGGYEIGVFPPGDYSLAGVDGFVRVGRFAGRGEEGFVPGLIGVGALGYGFGVSTHRLGWLEFLVFLTLGVFVFGIVFGFASDEELIEFDPLSLGFAAKGGGEGFVGEECSAQSDGAAFFVELFGAVLEEAHGKVLRLRTMEYGSACVWPISSRNLSSSV